MDEITKKLINGILERQQELCRESYNKGVKDCFEQMKNNIVKQLCGEVFAQEPCTTSKDINSSDRIGITITAAKSMYYLEKALIRIYNSPELRQYFVTNENTDVLIKNIMNDLVPSLSNGKEVVFRKGLPLEIARKIRNIFNQYEVDNIYC